MAQLFYDALEVMNKASEESGLKIRKYKVPVLYWNWSDTGEFRTAESSEIVEAVSLVNAMMKMINILSIRWNWGECMGVVLENKIEEIV